MSPPPPLLLLLLTVMTCPLLLQNGDFITFEWKMVGIGTEKCYHDDVQLPWCKSPITVQAMDVSSKDTQHKFRVEFTDVCGNTTDASFTYTQQGVTAVSKIDYKPVEVPPPPAAPTRTIAASSKNGAAAASSRSFAASLAMGLVGGAAHGSHVVGGKSR